MEDIFPIGVGNYKDQSQPLRFKIGIKKYGIESEMSFSRLEDLHAINNQFLSTNKPNVQMSIYIDQIREEGNQYIHVNLYGGELVITKRINILHFTTQLENVLDDDLTPPNSPRLR